MSNARRPMIRRILITDDTGNPVPVSIDAFPALIALAAKVLRTKPEAVVMLSSGYDTGYRFDAETPDGVLSDDGHAQRFGASP